MADKKGKISEEDEKKIPLLTVLKNGAILKNIFVINKPPSPSPVSKQSITFIKNAENLDEENEEILIVGRHPDCHIMLTHPSISRFHLQMNSNPSSQKLSVIDLSSVHGTWISGKKIEPGVSVELKEGDTIRVGGSTRVYRLHWVPLSRAYDMENPFVSAMDMTMTEDKEEENAMPEEENALESHQDENSLSFGNQHIEGNDSLVLQGKEEEECQVVQKGNSLSAENKEIQLMDWILEGINSIFSDENSELVVKKEIPSAPPMPENKNYSIRDEKEEDGSPPTIDYAPTHDYESREILSLWSGPFGTESVKLSLPVDGIISETENQEFNKANKITEHDSAMEISEVKNPESSIRRSEQKSNLSVNLDSSLSVAEVETHSAEEIPEETDYQSTFVTEAMKLSLPVDGVILVTENQEFSKDNQITKYDSVTGISEVENPESSIRRSEQKSSFLVNLDSSLSVAEVETHSADEIPEETDYQSPFGTEAVKLSLPVDRVISEIENQEFSKDNQITKYDSVTGISEVENPESSIRRSEQKSNFLVNLDSSLSVAEVETHSADEIPKETDYQSSLRKDNNEHRDISILWSGSPVTESMNSFFAVGEVLSETKAQQFNKENQTPQHLFPRQSLPERGSQETSIADRNLNFLENLNSAYSDEEGDHPAAEVLEEAKIQSLLAKDHEQGEILSFCCVPLTTESVNSSLPAGKALSEITDNKQSQTPQSLFVAGEQSEIKNFESSPIKSEENPSMCSIWSRRGKPATVLQIQTGRSRGKTIGADIDAEIELHDPENIGYKSISKALFSGVGGMEEEIFTPDKENFTPNTLLLKPFKKKGKLGEIKHSKSCRPSCSNVTCSPNIRPEEDVITSSDKENRTPKVLQQKKLTRHNSKSQVSLEQEVMVTKKRAERVPFQSLFVNSAGKSRSEAVITNTATRSCNSVNCTQTMEKKVTNSCSNNSILEGRRCWDMVVDTASLLDQESRKSLQLLQGLKGTRLIIPRMVIRELDCLKRRSSLFRRTADVDLVLEWIEECMVKTKWWIHVQSSMEDTRPIAPTPPASPQSQFSVGSGGFPCGVTSSVPFSSQGSIIEIVSPTPEDHILDCALLFRKLKNDGQLVLLSNDVTLKIKAMAEGLICETAQEFRESLVNPFSERFLWADSSPRGLTWSHLDDVVLREKYNRCPLKMSSKGGGGAKGLKLILLHNAHYGQISSIS